MINGNSDIFAAKIVIIKSQPLMGKTCLYIDGEEIGIFDSIERIAPFIKTLNKLAKDFLLFENNNLRELSPSAIFYRLNDEGTSKKKFTKEQIHEDRHNLFLGENFDPWLISAVYEAPNYLFVWDKLLNGVRQDVRFAKVSLSIIQKVCLEINQLIPHNDWPRFIDKYVEESHLG
ncbi:MAG: hypothetical protein JNL72_07940 [Flavipsychrobacter sp.]|nr:hypothetical protein [Flavipsychrobacter sp.]